MKISGGAGIEMTPEKSAPRYLLVTRIGKGSLHQRWINGPRDFDVVLSCYDGSAPPPEADGVSFESRPGYKVAGYHAFLQENKDIWNEYDYICLMDEDIEADCTLLNRIFALCAKYNLKIAQPALTWDSYFSHAGVLQHPGLLLRYVNFIEMMSPVFRRDVLEKVLPIYGMGYESGIDLIWCNLVFETKKDFAILDGAPVGHTEPIGGKMERNGFLGGRDYSDDIGKILKQFSLPWLSLVPYSAVSASRKEIFGKWRVLIYSLKIFPAFTRRHVRAARLIYIINHWRHIVFRKPTNIPVSPKD